MLKGLSQQAKLERSVKPTDAPREALIVIPDNIRSSSVLMVATSVKKKLQCKKNKNK